jgi:hypothetical protein
MRYSPILLLSFLLVGCATSQKYDPRLNGTWRSNRDETVAAAFQRDPRWTNAPPEKVAKFKDLFGHMTVTYGKDEVHTQDRDHEYSVRYRVLERGQDYVTIQTKGGGFSDGLSIRIRFVDGGTGYWTDSGKLLGNDTPEEKFDKITEPGGAANRSQPAGSERNRTSPAAGSGG